MSVTTFDACIPTITQILLCQKAILAKAGAHAEEYKIDASVLLNARLFPDMFPFKKQIQIMTDIGTRGAARLSGSEIPSNPDTEETFAELSARVSSALEFISKLKPEQFEGAETKTYEIPLGGDKKTEMTGQNYLSHFVLPNVIFHAATAYGILRHNGIELGKLDFLQPPS